MGAYGAEITEEAAQFIAQMAGGDARRALNAVELGILTTEPDENGRILIDLAAAEECIQRKAVNYDRDGDNHYDTISAFIKSMRGTDPDAAVFYLARMLDAGEDPKFIARRIMMRIGRCRQCRSAGISSCGSSFSGGRADWYAGS